MLLFSLTTFSLLTIFSEFNINIIVFFNRFLQFLFIQLSIIELLYLLFLSISQKNILI